MPKLKKTEEQRRVERFWELYKIGKAKTGFTDEQCAAIAEVCPTTIYNAKKATDDRISIGQFARFIKAFGWSKEDVISIFF